MNTKKRETIKCLQCEHEFRGRIFCDELGWHASCPKCDGSFDVECEHDYVIELWQYDFAPYSSIDDLPKHHVFVKQFMFDKTETIEDCCELLQQLKLHEGLTYQLFHKNGQFCGLGVFSDDSLWDDIWS